MSSEAEYNDQNSSYLFSVSYAERELACLVQRRGNQFDVLIDNNLQATLELKPDGSLEQVSGNDLPASTIAFIKKQVIEKVNGTENS